MKSLSPINHKDILNESSCTNTNESSLLNIRDNGCVQLEKVDGTENDPPTSNRDIVQQNQCQVLINDCDLWFENEVTAAKINISHKPPSRQRNEIKIKSPRNVIDRFPEKDDAQLKKTNISPGNTPHFTLTSHGRKINYSLIVF